MRVSVHALISDIPQLKNCNYYIILYVHIHISTAKRSRHNACSQKYEHRTVDL